MSDPEHPELSLHQKETLRMGLVDKARLLLGIPYDFGAEWVDISKPPEALDCSELVENVYKQNGLRMPDGSQNQFIFTSSTGNPLPGDLGFFGRGGNPYQVYHVGMVFDTYSVIEARGFDPKSSFETGKVILRPRLAWEKYSSFLGWRKHPKL